MELSVADLPPGGAPPPAAPVGGKGFEALWSAAQPLLAKRGRLKTTPDARKALRWSAEPLAAVLTKGVAGGPSDGAKAALRASRVVLVLSGNAKASTLGLANAGAGNVKLARFILQAGLSKGEGSPDLGLRDELWLQAVRQATANPRRESELRIWQVMYLMAVTFLPSKGLTIPLGAWLGE